MNNYNCLKQKFREIPVGTYFTYIGDNGEHHYYFKTIAVEASYDSDTAIVNSVVIQGLRAGQLEGFDDDIRVYAGII